jgi:chemotaxis protein CheY-P-specific phosphatase CheC
MKEQIEKILYRVTEEVLGKLAFIFSFPQEDREVMTGPAASASVSFTGPFSGRLLMRISETVLPDMAGNMLGVEKNETTAEHHYDALKELINVICGNLLPRIGGRKAIFNVGTPQIISDDIPDPAALTALAKMEMDEGECDLFLFIQGDLPPDALRIEGGDL